MSPNLRDYQKKDVERIRAAFGSGRRRVLYVAPTGSGKTVTFAYVAANAVAKGKTVVILGHRIEITEQIGAALAAMEVRHGRIQPGHPMMDAIVQVAMVQTVARRLDKIAAPDLVVIDEAHHAVAGTWQKVLDAWPKAKILGVTATPERLDGRELGDVFDEMVIGPDVADLIGQGFIAPFTYIAPDAEIDLSGVRTLGGDFIASDLAAAVDRNVITGNVVEHYRKHLSGRTAICFCITVAHAEHVAAEFRANGVTAASIDGTMTSAERTSLVTRLRDGELRVLTSCELISEGFDAPAVGGAILLRPTQSFALFRQQVGRCLRPKPDGSAAVILDHVGNVFRHGLPDAPHEWSLDSAKRRNGEKVAPAVRKCRACSIVFPIGATPDGDCPSPDAPDCFFMHVDIPKETSGTLAEISFNPPWAEGIDIRTARGRDFFRLVELAGDRYERLRLIQVVRGYKAAWTWHRRREAAEQSEVVS